MYRGRYRRPAMPTGIGLVLFLIVAAVLAVFVARVLGSLIAVVLHLAWYAIAFAVAFAILSWLWSQFTGRRDRTATVLDAERDEYGRKRY